MEYKMESPNCGSPTDTTEKIELWLNTARISIKNDCHDHTVPAAIFRLVTDVQRNGIANLETAVFKAKLDTLSQKNGIKRTSVSKTDNRTVITVYWFQTQTLITMILYP